MDACQIPTDFSLAGVYGWTLRLSAQTITGHVIVRGPDADPIGNYTFPQNTESWYYASVQQEQNGKQSFEIGLERMAQPNDQALNQLVGQIVASDTEMGQCSMTASWEQGAPLPQDPTVFTMVEVKDGPGKYGDLYQHVSLVMPVDGEPLMPTWYTDIEDLFSIFGGDAQNVPVENGTTAFFKAIGSSDAGYPGQGWSWTGRDPS